ncbi:HeH/LEM domain-containing protein [uncultured Streptococcus sp.]|uniref:HeH/LEM domain-containing protein n=1 Tax=uncultured Streptococcus sp. TaxID=83427 RepID=UPI0025D7F420|nr:HeH/LEM domain-containing protein [uncultured Streptococcus sp.]
MTYKTTKAVRDTQDNGFYYHAGATYPRQGLEVSKERLETLVKNGYIVKVELTSKEIKAKLDELGVDYKSSASKAELLSLLEGGE